MAFTGGMGNSCRLFQTAYRRKSFQDRPTPSSIFKFRHWEIGLLLVVSLRHAHSSIGLCLSPLVCLSVYPAYLSVFESAPLCLSFSACLSASKSVCFCIHLSLYLPICLPVCVSVQADYPPPLPIPSSSFTRTHTHTQTHTHTHTQTHAHTRMGDMKEISKLPAVRLPTTLSGTP